MEENLQFLLNALRVKALVSILVLAAGLNAVACFSQPQPAPPVPTPGNTSGGPSPQGSSSEPVVQYRTFRIVPEESEARYEVNEEITFIGVPLNRTIGRTSAIEGEISFGVDSEGNLQIASNEFTVDLRTLTSDDPRRDERIREEWLESDRFPFARFVGKQVRDFPDDAQEGSTWEFKLRGDMTIRETTRSLTYDIRATVQGDKLEGQASTFLLMKDFGFDPPRIAGLFEVEDGVDVIVEFTAREVR